MRIFNFSRKKSILLACSDLAPPDISTRFFWDFSKGIGSVFHIPLTCQDTDQKVRKRHIAPKAVYRQNGPKVGKLDIFHVFCFRTIWRFLNCLSVSWNITGL